MSSIFKHFEFFNFLEKNQIIISFIFLFIIFSSLIFLFYRIYLLENSISEALLEQPKTFNPILARNDSEKIISAILFRSLIKPNGKGDFVYDLAKNITFNSSTKEYLIDIKKEFWSDGNPITSDDFVFTFKIIKLDSENPAWPIFKNLEIEKLDSNTFKIKIKEEGDWEEKNFIYQYLTFKVIPHHIWSKINYQNWILSKENFEPVTNGFFRIKKISKNKDGSFRYIVFEKIKNIEGIKRIKLVFVTNEEEVRKKFLLKKINIFLTENPSLYDFVKFKYKIKIPRYFALWIEDKKIKNYFKDLDLSFLKDKFENLDFYLNLNSQIKLNEKKKTKEEKNKVDLQGKIKIFFPDNKIIEKILIEIKNNLKEKLKIELVKLDQKTFQEKILNNNDFLKENFVLFGEKYYIIPYFPFLNYKATERGWEGFVKINEKMKKSGKPEESFLKEVENLPIVFLFNINQVYLSNKKLNLEELYLNDESERYLILPYLKN